MQRELDIAQREAKLRAATFYGDAGAQLRDSAKFGEEMRKTQEEMDTKKQALDAANQKLSDLQEEARKAGDKDRITLVSNHLKTCTFGASRMPRVLV